MLAIGIGRNGFEGARRRMMVITDSFCLALFFDRIGAIFDRLVKSPCLQYGLSAIIESSKEAILPINEKEVYDDEKITWTWIYSGSSCGCHNGNGWLSKDRCEYLAFIPRSLICLLHS